MKKCKLISLSLSSYICISSYSFLSECRIVYWYNARWRDCVPVDNRRLRRSRNCIYWRINWTLAASRFDRNPAYILFPVLSAPFLSLPLLLLSSPSFSPCLLFPFPYPCLLPFSPSPSPLSHLLFYSPPFPLPSYLPPFSPTLISFHPPSPLFFSSLPPSPLFLSSLPPSPTNITTKAILAGVGWTISPKTRLSY